ncbi:hypothetical protein BH11PSE7_BH11PSE7_17260 [soil metagenome]
MSVPHPGASMPPAHTDSTAARPEADHLRQELQASKLTLDELTARLQDITASADPQDHAARQEAHDFLRARSNAQLILAGNPISHLPASAVLSSLSGRAQVFVRLHDDRERQLALYRRHEVDLFTLEEPLEQADPPADSPSTHDEDHPCAMSAQDLLAALKTRHDELESARSHWLRLLAAATPAQRQDTAVASAFVSKQLMGCEDVSASAIWQWMPNLPGFSDLTPGQQVAVRSIAAFKVEDGSCWKSAVQIEAHEAAMIEQPASRLKQREALLAKVKPVQDACAQLCKCASARYSQDHELILSLKASGTMRRQFMLGLTRQIRADRKALAKLAAAPADSGAANASQAQTLQSLRANEVKLMGLRNQASVALKIAALGVPADRALLAQRQGVLDMYTQALETTQSRIIDQLEVPWRTTALATGRQVNNDDALRLGQLQRAHATHAQTFLGVVARLGEAQRGLSVDDNDALDTFIDVMVNAGRQDPLVWHSVERLPGYEALTGPVKRAVQLVAQSRVCNVAVQGLETEIENLKAHAETKG